MPQQSPEERRQYQARLKYARDEWGRLDYAEKKGEFIGEIRFLQERLDVPKRSRDQLAAMGCQELEQLLEVLRRSFDRRA